MKNLQAKQIAATGNRTPVYGMKTRRPGPLDDSGMQFHGILAKISASRTVARR